MKLLFKRSFYFYSSDLTVIESDQVSNLVVLVCSNSHGTISPYSF